MKTIFIINPAAGQGKNLDALQEKIKNAGKELGVDIEIYITKCQGDAEDFTRSFCQTKGAARFIVCGGDGTLNEVLNGAMVCKDAEVGVLPCGTGNDFYKNFQEGGNFFDPKAQLQGSAVSCDAIRYESTKENEPAPRFCANMFNIGFDANVADLASTMKRKPFVSGPLAYLLSIFVMLIKKKGANLTLVKDGELLHDGPLLLTSVANGSYCGGGIKSNPLASVSDGKINMNIIYNLTRPNFLHKLFYYRKGTHIHLPGIERYILTTSCTELIVTPKEGSIRISIDGEMEKVGETRFTIVPQAFRFVVPAK